MGCKTVVGSGLAYPWPIASVNFQNEIKGIVIISFHPFGIQTI